MEHTANVAEPADFRLLSERCFCIHERWIHVSLWYLGQPRQYTVPKNHCHAAQQWITVDASYLSLTGLLFEFLYLVTYRQMNWLMLVTPWFFAPLLSTIAFTLTIRSPRIIAVRQFPARYVSHNNIISLPGFLVKRWWGKRGFCPT